VTLLELLTAMSILVLMSAVAAVAFLPVLQEARLRASARIVISALQYARSYAVAHRVATAVQCDVDARTVAVVRRETAEDGDMTDTERWQPVTTPAGRPRMLPEGITFGDITYNTDTGQSSATATFTPLGQADDGRIVLLGAREQRRVVAIDGITGQCDIVSDNP